RRLWPDVMAIVEARVRPERTRRNSSGAFALREPLPTRWWHHADKRPALYAAIAALERVLVVPQTSNVQALAFLPTRMVFSHTLVVFPFATYSAFAVLQSRFHQIWSMFLGPTMKDDRRYTPSDCFETFPLPEEWDLRPVLEAAGKACCEFRASLM